MNEARPIALAAALVWLVGCASPTRIAVLAPIEPAPANQAQTTENPDPGDGPASQPILPWPAVEDAATPAAGLANAPEAANAFPGKTKPSLQARPAPGFLDHLPELALEPTKPNELDLGKFSFSGIAVQFLKADHPLQLLNPAAQAQYGSGMDNLDQFSFSGTGPLLKVFSISF